MTENTNISGPQISRLPLYKQVEEKIFEQFIAGKPTGTRLPTEIELEAIMNVSSITVRNALKELVRAGHLERRQGAGTFTLEHKQTTSHVALLLDVDISDKLLSPYYTKLLQELRKSLFKLGISSRPYLGFQSLGAECGELTCSDFFEELRNNHICGVVPILAYHHSTWISEIRKRSIPIVGPRPFCDNVVGVDELKAVRTILARCKDRGRSRIAMIGWQGKRQTTQGIHAHMEHQAAEYGISIQKSLMQLDANGWDAGVGWQAFREIWCRNSEKPDCLFLSNDILFSECETALIESGVNDPDSFDIIVYGSDAVKLAPQRPIIRCIFSHVFQAQEIAKAISNRLHRKQEQLFLEVPFNLVTEDHQILDGVTKSETDFENSYKI